MAEGWPRSTYRFSEHLRRMKAHLYYLLLLAAGASAAPQLSSMAELLTLLQQMGETVRDTWTQRIETPNNINDVNCVNTIFKGTEQLKGIQDMKKFGGFFQKFERLKQWLTPNLEKEGECNTERKNPRIFIQKLMTYIRKASRHAKA